MKKKVLYLFAFSIILFGLNYNNVMADEERWDDVDTTAGDLVNRGGCIDNSLCQNQNFIMFETTVTHMDNSGVEVYDKYYFTNNASKVNGSNVIYVPGMTTTAYDFGTAGMQLQNYLSANDYAAAKDLLAKSGITAFNGSSNGRDAFGLISQPYMQYQDSNGNLQMATLKEMLQNDSVNNKTRVMEYLSMVATGLYGHESGTLLEYINGFTTEECKTMSALIASGAQNGCGQLIIDLANLLKINKIKPTPACPGGTMNLNNPTPTCKQQIGGVIKTYSYTASAGSQSNVHRQYGIDQNAPGTGAYCKLYCQEEGTATLPGALADAVQLGSYIIWPTSSSNTTNKFPKADNYPLKFSGKKSCKLVLMPDHNNFPGNGCLQDPVAEYMCIYNASTVAGSKYVCGRTYNSSIRHIGLEVGDYVGVHYETVRVANGNYFNEPEYCGTEKYGDGTLKNNGKAGRGTYQLYNIKQTSQYYNSDSFGRGNYSYYKNLTNEINNKARTAVSACQGITQGDINTASQNTQCSYCSGGYDENGFCKKTSEKLCDYIQDARDKINRCNEADADYSRAVDATKSIEDSMASCRSYITDFNYARNILNEIGLCGNFSASGEDYYHFSSKASMSYNNGEYSVSGNLSKESSATIGCSGQCGGLSFKEKPDYTSFATMDTPAILAGKVSQIENRTIVFTADSDVYESNSNYSYVDKKKNKYSKSQLNSNYLEIKSINGGLAKVLPTDYNVDILDSNKNAIQYTLNLKDTAFGENNRFNVTNSGDYVCKYEMAKKNDGCICPQDSKMPGKDLMKHVAEDPISCADAQQKYCDNGPEEPYDKLYCPDMQTPLTSCLKTGIGYQKCVDLVCPGTYKCKNTNGLRTGMDITDCVQTKLAQGLTVAQALNYCDSVVCPIGKSIIYRTIKLENPFPGKDISKIVTGFNNDVKGRYPGTNWNGVLTVYNKIRNNREHDTDSQAIATNTNSTSGTTIYQTKEPLYTFVLNGVTIQNIRDYNEKQKDGYNDFKLECKTNHSSGCISEFVHNINLSGLTSGTCQNISLDNSFYTCAE